jgi:hypothetical protein
MKKSLILPEFSRLSKRCSQSLSRITLPSLKEPTHLVIDLSGLKVFGEKEMIKPLIHPPSKAVVSCSEPHSKR